VNKSKVIKQWGGVAIAKEEDMHTEFLRGNQNKETTPDEDITSYITDT